MKKLLFVALVAALSSCDLLEIHVGNNVSATTGIEVGEFESISNHCSLGIIYTQTEGEPSVTLTCDENLVDYYDIKVEGNSLEIDIKRGKSIRTKVKSYVTVTSPSLDDISLSGSGSCRITSPLLSSGDVNFEVSGSGSILAKGAVECRDFSSSTSGSGRIDVSAVLADAVKLKGSGSGSTRVDLITADIISARLSGSGGANLVCKDAGDIEVSISGSGSAHLSGNARSLKSETTGSGRVDSRNLILGD